MKLLVAVKFDVIIIPLMFKRSRDPVLQTDVESRTQGSRPRPKIKKKKKPRPRTDFPRTDPLEAKDRNALGQVPRIQRASGLQKDGKFSAKF